MRRRSLQPKTQIQQIFLDRSSTIYYSMRTRFASKYDDGRLISYGRPVPFTLDEYRVWLLVQFGGSWDNPARCAYCSAFLTVADFETEHIIPASSEWNGSLDLSNLCLACGYCNRRKGKMSGDGFRALVQFLLTLDTRDMTDVLTRLATGREGQKELWKRQAIARRRSQQAKEPF